MVMAGSWPSFGGAPAPAGNIAPPPGVGSDTPRPLARSAEDEQYEQRRLSQEQNVRNEAALAQAQVASAARIQAAENQANQQKQALRSDIERARREFGAWDAARSAEVMKIENQLARNQTANRAAENALKLQLAQQLVQLTKGVAGYEQGLERAGTTTENPYAPGGSLEGQLAPPSLRR